MTHHTKTQRLASILLTVAVIGILLLAGPAQAVTLGFGTPSHTSAPAGTTITFDTTVEVTADEIIPITTVTLKVNGVDCVFPVEGGASISVEPICQGLTIERDETVGAYQYSQNLNGYGYNYGYGYSYSYGYGYGYGYDYGYGYGYGSQRLALRYHVTWDTTLYSPDAYSFHFLVNANEGDFSYSTDEPLVITITGGSEESFSAFSSGSSGSGGGGGGGGCIPGYVFVKSDGRCYKAEEVPLLLPPPSEEGSNGGFGGNDTEQAVAGDSVENTVEGDEKSGGNLLTGAIAGFLTGTSWLWLLLLVILIAALLAYWMAKKNN